MGPFRYEFGRCYTEGVNLRAFVDELQKIAVSAERLHRVAKARKGRPAIRAHTLLAKDTNGSLYKKAMLPIVAFSDAVDPAQARRPRKKGEVPSREDVDTVDRRDGRDSTTTVHGMGQSLGDIGAWESR